MPKNYNLACAINHHRRMTPQAPAVVCQGQLLTYAELAERAAGLAASLASSRGWRSDRQPPRVGIFASRGIDACVALLGACWAGATYVPIGLKQPEERILALLAQCKLSAIIADDQGMKLLTERLLAACPQLVIHVSQVTPANRMSGPVQPAGLPPVILEEPAL